VERRQQVPILHVISREYYAMYAMPGAHSTEKVPFLN